MEIPHSDSNPLSFLHHPQHSDFNAPLKTNVKEVATIIKTLNPVGGGFDKISTEILLLSYKSIVDHLVFFFNLCLSTGTFPDKLKIATIKPIYKAGDRNVFNNYRPISLLPVFSKILEKILHTHVINYLDENNLLNPLQFGFRKKHSTYMPIAHLVDNITSSLEESQFTCVLYLDLKKAFDTVSLNILLKKMYYIGLKGKLYDILRSYLTSRIHRTQSNSYLSKEAMVKMGVPQGSVLGPLLFILYINDISNITKEVDFYLFADDTAITFKGSDVSEVQNKIDRLLPKIANWFQSNRLSLNTTKTFYQVFPKSAVEMLNIVIGDSKIERKETVKYLGIAMEENLKWQEHINNISRSMSQGIGMMGRAKYYLSSEHLLLLYNTLILPHLNYCAAVWGANYPSRLDKLVKLQKRALRIIDKKPYFYHTRDLFIKYKLLKFPDLVKEQQIVILLGYLNETLPDPLAKMFEYHGSVCTRAVQHFKIPFASTNYKMFSLSVSAPRIWNSIVFKLFNNLDNVPRNKATLKKHVRKFISGRY